METFSPCSVHCTRGATTHTHTHTNTPWETQKQLTHNIMKIVKFLDTIFAIFVFIGRPQTDAEMARREAQLLLLPKLHKMSPRYRGNLRPNSAATGIVSLASPFGKISLLLIHEGTLTSGPINWNIYAYISKYCLDV